MTILLIDESGDLGEKGSKNFVLTVLIFFSVNEYRKLYKIKKNIANKKFKRDINRNNEIKFYSTSNKFRKSMLKRLNSLDFYSFSIVMEKTKYKNREILRKKNKNEIYVDLTIKLLEKMNIQHKFLLKMDKFLLGKHLQSLLLMISNSEKIFNKNSEIIQVDSKTEIGIQFVDLISGSLFQKIEKDNSEFIDIIKNKHEFFFY